MASNLVRVKRHVLRLDNVYGTHYIEGEILWTWIWGQITYFYALNVSTKWLRISMKFYFGQGGGSVWKCEIALRIVSEYGS